SPRSGWASSVAYAPTATTGSTPTMPRAPRSARMAPLPTRAIRGTQAHRGTTNRNNCEERALARLARCEPLRAGMERLRGPPRRWTARGRRSLLGRAETVAHVAQGFHTAFRIVRNVHESERPAC